MRKTVFISSTYEDLKKHRAKIWEDLSSFDVNIRGMEQFGARTEAPLLTCLAEVEQSDIYIGIIALRLGNLDPESGKSFTQLEYEKALELKKEILIYLIDENNAKVTPAFIDFGEKHEKLKAFKSVLKERHTIDTFTDENDLSEKMTRRLNELLLKKPVDGISQDEYEAAREIITNLYLLPKIYSGREIKLKVLVLSQPFPASKAICEAFGLEYGSTVGLRIDIIDPKMEKTLIQHIFIDDSFVEQILGIKTGDIYEIYGKVLFIDKNIQRVEASYSDSITTFEFIQNLKVLNKGIPAEGKIIVVLNRIIKIINEE